MAGEGGSLYDLMRDVNTKRCILFVCTKVSDIRIMVTFDKLGVNTKRCILSARTQVSDIRIMVTFDKLGCSSLQSPVA
jgi:predicted ATP-dependent serine protease